MNRTQATLAGLLLIQLVLILLVRSPFTSATASVELRPLLPELDAVSPSRVQLDGQDDQTLTLRKAGEGWVLEEMDDFPADTTKIDDVLTVLRELQIRRPVVKSSRYHEAFEVADDENAGRIRVWSNGADDPEVDLILGSSPNYQITHVRRSGEDPVYEASGVAAYEFRPEAGTWAAKELVEIDESQLVGLRLTNGTGTFELSRVEGSWTITAPAEKTSEELDADKVDALVRVARSIRIADAVGAADPDAQGFRSPAATVELRYSPTEGQTESVVVFVGGSVADKDQQRYVTREGWEFAGSIWESSVKKFLEQSLLDLLPSEES